VEGGASLEAVVELTLHGRRAGQLKLGVTLEKGGV
jgi:hypothetical protein